MKIYTKTGDDGTTGLFSGARVSKASASIEAYGTVDELNALIGLIGSSLKPKEKVFREKFLQIQHDLHAVCADLATPLSAKSARLERVSIERAARLEKWIDEMEKGLKPLKQFILAGGTELSARIHLARTVSRRAERRAIAYQEASKEVNSDVVIYLNRLSDFLFVAARYANKKAKVSDVLWDKSL